MNWKTVTLKDGRKRHHAQTKTRHLSVYDWTDGHVDWCIYDETGNNLIAEGKSASANEAKQAAEQAAMKGVR